MGTPTTDRGGIQQVLRALAESGHTLSYVFDGEEDVKVDTKGQALDAIMAVDDAFLHVTLPDGERTGWVRFVLGNDPDEVVCDYTVNLEVVDKLTSSWWD